MIPFFNSSETFFEINLAINGDMRRWVVWRESSLTKMCIFSRQPLKLLQLHVQTICQVFMANISIFLVRIHSLNRFFFYENYNKN